jgi:hypothetical protein
MHIYHHHLFVRPSVTTQIKSFQLILQHADDMMDQLYREVSTAFPGRVISHIDVRQEREAYRVLRIGFRGVRSESLFRSFLHERNQLKALVEACINDAEDLGLTLPYEQLNRLLLAASKDINVTSTDKVLVLGGASVEGRSVGMRSPRPGVEGFLLRGDNTLAGVISRSKVASRASPSSELASTSDRKKLV